MKDLPVPQFKQKTVFNCIPACLQQVFAYYNKQISQEEILNSLGKPERGMSIPAAAVFVKRQGLNPAIVTNNINIFDPAWFSLETGKLVKYLEKRKSFVGKYSQSVIEEYLEYLRIGGRINFSTIGEDLLVKNLAKNTPIIIELSSTFLYKKSKSTKPGQFNDAFKGEIEGHGVVIAGFNQDKFKIVDPDSSNNPYDQTGIYWIPAKELMASFSILEGKSLLLINRN